MIRLMRIKSVVLIVYDAVVVLLLSLLLLYRDQFLLGDKMMTLSPNSFPSLYAIALLAVDLELEPYSSTEYRSE